MPRQHQGGYASSSAMARFVTKVPGLTPRLATHTIVLIAVVGVTLASAFTRATPEMVVATVGSEPSDSGQGLPAQRALEIDTRAALPRAALPRAALPRAAAQPAAAVTQGGDQR